jgi:hypothetical protein
MNERLVSRVAAQLELFPSVPRKSTRVPSPTEVLAGSTDGKGHGFTKKILAAWGISWPPPRGWRRELERQWRNQKTIA